MRLTKIGEFERPVHVAAPPGNPVDPILEQPHGPGDCSIIAGVEVRDPRLPVLAERFLFGDYCTGVVEAVTIVDGTVADRRSLGVIVPELSSFGVDGLGRVYLTSTAGAVYRLDPA